MSNEYQYAEFVTGNIANRNRITRLKDIRPADYEGKTECYCSAFAFGEDFKAHVDNLKTVSGFGGNVLFNFIYVDFDSLSDLEKAKRDIEDYIEHGLQQFITFEDCESLRISFSGAKGFTLAIPREMFSTVKPHRDLNKRVKKFVQRIADICNDETGRQLETIDFAIYNKDRLIRLNNTINAKSGLFKIPLTYTELLTLTIDEIKEIAKKQKTVEYIKAVPRPELAELFYSLDIYEKQAGETKGGSLFLNLQPAETGKRNATLFKNALYLKDKLNAEDVIEILSGWNNSLREPLDKGEFESTVNSALKHVQPAEITEDDILNFDKRLEKYREYVKNVQKKRVNIGFPLIDNHIRGLRAGNLCTLLAETGIGKSAIIQNILMNHTRETGNLSVLFSFEMLSEELLERELQIEFDIKGADVESGFQNNAEAMTVRCNMIRNGHNNFLTIVKRIDVNLIPEYIRNIERLTKKKVGLVGIDYLALVKNLDFPKDEYLRITDNMIKLKQHARELEMPFFVLSQVARNEVRTNQSISLFGGKGSGEVENSSDIVLSLEKSKEVDGTDEIEYLTLTILKNRRGMKGRIILEYNKNNLRITESPKNDELKRQQQEARANRQGATNKEYIF